jgi:hypothetical protein
VLRQTFIHLISTSIESHNGDDATKKKVRQFKAVNTGYVEIDKFSISKLDSLLSCPIFMSIILCSRTPCHLVSGYQCFGGSWCNFIQGTVTLQHWRWCQWIPLKCWWLPVKLWTVSMHRTVILITYHCTNLTSVTRYSSKSYDSFLLKNHTVCLLYHTD